MSQPFLLSIVIPVYNYGHTLRRAVNSILEQRQDEVEIILIDDGSKDNSADVCKNLATQNKNIHFVSQANSGAAAARNRGIGLAKGEYIIFLDADDEFCSSALKKITDTIKEKHPDVIIGGHLARHEDGSQDQHKPGHLPEKIADRVRAYLIDKKIRISNGAIVMHRSVFDRGVFPEQFRNSEDIPIFTQALCSENVIFVEEALVIVNKHGDSLRHQSDLAIQAGMLLADEVFNDRRVPHEALVWKSRYKVQRLLSLMRSLYISGQYAQARVLYGQALRERPVIIFKWAYTSKALRALFRRDAYPSKD
jgi:glycosyltransferase involved in cell wall biosynthesis